MKTIFKGYHTKKIYSVYKTYLNNILNDVYVKPELIETWETIFESDKEIDLVKGDLIFLDDEEVRIIEKSFDVNNFATVYKVSVQLSYIDDKESYDKAIEIKQKFENDKKEIKDKNEEKVTEPQAKPKKWYEFWK